jgi:ribose/xylose/arabinose/galactoside ABC-type transport system permease subunit
VSEFLRKHRNELGLAVAVLTVVTITAALSDTYHTAAGRMETARIILREAAMLGIFALGAAVVIIAGGIDLSAGSIIAFSGTIFFGVLILLAPDDPGTRWATDPAMHQPQTDELAAWIPIVALLATLAIAFLIGSFHTWLITVIELPPFVATLASLVGLRSLARLLIQDLTAMEYGQRQSTITINDELLTSVGRENWWVACVLWLVLSAALWVLLGKTVIGRHVYAMGGNEEAARLSGIRTDRLKWLAYCLSSMTAALAGVLYACYIGATNPASDGMGYELNAIAAAVVGGCSLTGGIGSVAGVMLGTLFLRVIIDSVAKLFRSQPDLFEGLVVGVLVVLAVAFNQLRGAGGLRKPYFPGLLGLLNVAIISALSGVMMAVTSSDAKLRNGLLVAGGTLIILGSRAIAERVQGRGSRV